VKRYAHLSPAYLQGAIEEVSRFGKVEPAEGKPETPVSNGTVTKTVIERIEEGEEVA
jgi:hypothetical protein